MSFEQGDAVEAPGGVDEFLDELRLGRRGRLVLGEELAFMSFVGGRVFAGKNHSLGGEAVSERIA